MWYARPVLFVADTARASAFYCDKLGFAEVWSYADNGVIFIAQVEREGCELILSQQFPQLGQGMMFISLNGAGFVALPDDCRGNGVELQEGWWGYRCLIVTDPDGNQLYFPDPNDKGGAA